MQHIRIIQIPKMKVVMSGPLTDKKSFNKFKAWWKEYDKGVQGKLTAHDFVWYNSKIKATEWCYVLPVPVVSEDFGGFKTAEFDFGLYAVATCLDADCDDCDDWMHTRQEVEKWVKESDCFELSNEQNDVSSRYTMYHSISPEIYYKKKGIHQQDMYVPIVLK